jgi:hypothetical protein
VTKLFEDRIAEAGRRVYMANHYGALVEAAGYLDGTIELTPEDCFFLASRIMRDVYQLAWENKKTVWGALVDLDYLAAIKSLGVDGCAALRARINYTPLPIIRGGPSR